MGTKITIFGNKMLKKFFSITNYNNTHKMLQIFGIKIKFPKKEIIEKFQNLPFDNYIKENIEITTIPPATGNLRKIQLANLVLLLELDYVCKQANIKYWLDFGTLLGAYRHKGFIPWDDDIDIGMPRDDYENFVEYFNKNTRTHDLYATFTKCENDPLQVIIKIKHHKIPYIFIDIFPYDISYGTLSLEKQLKKTQKIKFARKILKKNFSNNVNIDVLRKSFKDITNNIFKEKESKEICYFWGIDYNHHWKNWFVEKDLIYPLKEIIFENFSFPCINNIEGYLKKVYGNYMSYPKKFGFGHSMFVNFTKEEEKIINEFILDKEIL